MSISRSEYDRIRQEVDEGDDPQRLRRIIMLLLGKMSIVPDPYESGKSEQICRCGHSYYRHFDSWGIGPNESPPPVGCKYCECDEFSHEMTGHLQQIQPGRNFRGTLIVGVRDFSEPDFAG